tara:strand:+ start:558 stop:920 length:363 start_codon:yes stop_codon:yes gene_type:complete
MKTLGKELHCTKFSDPGHGWLAVKIELAKQSGAKISPFSYQRGKTAYLEEDSDAPAFVQAIEIQGFKVFVEERHTDRNSPIRSYASFSQEGTFLREFFAKTTPEQFIRDHFVFVRIGGES